MLPLTVFGQTPRAEVLFYGQDAVVEDGKLRIKFVYKIQINNHTGEEFCEIRIQYSKLNTLNNIEGELINSDGSVVRKLSKKEITERSAFSRSTFYEDDMVKEFTLKHNTYPYIISYSYELETTQFFNIAKWTPVVDLTVPTRKAELSVTLPDDYPFTYMNKNCTEPTTTHTDDKKTIVWTGFYSEQIEQEELSPTLSELIPMVQVIPEKFKFEEEGSATTWQSFGDWIVSLAQNQTQLSAASKSEIITLTDTIVSQKEKIRTLYHKLQDETRYINISIETGGLKPYSAYYVDFNKYGDCKALSNYFKTVLEVIDIKAYYTLIHAGSKISNIDTSTVAQQFNHAVLWVPITDDTLWLDCTSDLAFGYCGTFIQNRTVLLTEKNNSKLYKSDKLTVNQVAEHRNISAVIADDKSVTAEYSNLYRGEMYETISYLRTYHSDTEILQTLNKRFADKQFTINNFEITSPHRDSSYILLKYTAKSSNHCKLYGKDLIFKLLPFELPEPEKPQKRKTDINIDFPIHKHDLQSFKLPDGYDALSIPENIQIQSKYGTYSAKYSYGNNLLSAEKVFVLFANHYDVSEYTLFYDFLLSVKNAENCTFVFNQKP